MEGAHVLDVFGEGGVVGEGLEVHEGWAEAEDEEGASIGGEKLVGGGADDDGEAARLELEGDRVRGDGDLFALAVGGVGGLGGFLNGVELALEGAGISGDGSSGGVRDGGRLGWGGAKHYEVRGATGAAGVSGVDGVLDVGDEVAPGGRGEGDKAPAE